MTATTPKKILAFKRLEKVGLANWLKDANAWDKESFAIQIRKAMSDAYGLEVEIDEHLVTMLADQMDTYVRATQKLLTEDLIEVCHNGARMANPNQKIRDGALGRIMQLMTMLGLVPAGRPKRSNTPSDIDELLAGPQY